MNLEQKFDIMKMSFYTNVSVKSHSFSIKIIVNVTLELLN